MDGNGDNAPGVPKSDIRRALFREGKACIIVSLPESWRSMTCGKCAEEF